MDQELILNGAKGGGSTAVEQDDTIRSRQIARLLFVVSEGEVEEISPSNIYIDGVAATTYGSVKIETRTGLPDQTVIPGFENVETPHPNSAPVELKYNVPQIKNVSSVNILSVRCILTFNSLVTQDEKGNTNGASVTHQVSVRARETAQWQVAKTITRTEKSTGAFSVSFRAFRPKDSIPEAGDIWGIRIVRKTADDDTAKKNTKCSWTGTIEIQDPDGEGKGLTYPNIALVGVTFRNSLRFGGNIPEILFIIKGLKVKVPGPTYYNAAEGTYTGVPWNGVFDSVKRWTSNPAWAIYDVITRPKLQGGLGWKESRINRYSFWELAKYCDELVPLKNNLGVTIGWEKRFTLANQFIRREQAKNTLTYLLAICNANFSNDLYGNLTIISDRPEYPSDQVTNSDVIDGMFDYFSNDVEDRVTYVNVTYNNPNELGKTDTITVPGENPTTEEQEIIDRYGYQTSDVVLIGCKSKSQAVRKARWVWYTNNKTPDLCTFRILFRGLRFYVGLVFNILDQDNQNVAQQGKIVSCTAGSLEFRVQLDRVVPADCTSFIYHSVNGLKEMPIAEFAGLTFIRFPVSPDTPIVGSSYILAGEIRPTTWKVAKIAVDTEKQIHTITCTQYDINKFTYVDQGVFLPAPKYVSVQNAAVPAVTDIQVREQFYRDAVYYQASLVVTWSWEDLVNTNYNPWFQVFWRANNGSFSEVKDLTTKEFEIPNALPGVYEIIIYAYNTFSLKSAATSFLYSYKVEGASTLLPPINLQIEGTTGTTFTGKDAVVVWTDNPANEEVSDRLLDYVVEVWSSDGITKKNTFIVPDFEDRFVYTFAQNEADFGTSQRSFQLKVYSRDVSGAVSVPTSAVFSNPAPFVVSLAVSSSFNFIHIRVTTAAEADLAGYLVHISTTDGFTPGPDNLYTNSTTPNILYTGPDTSLTYYIRVAAYDVFGQTGLNYSSQYTAATTNLDEIIEESVLDSAYFQSLVTRVDLVQAADTVPGSFAYAVAQEAIARGTAIANETTARQTADANEITNRQALAVAITGFTDPAGKTLSQLSQGLIYEEKSVRAAQDVVLATNISQLVARLTTGGDIYESIVTVDTKANAATDNIGVLASQVTTLQTNFNNTTTAIQQTLTTHNNTLGTLSGQYTVKIDLNGAVSGFGLASTATDQAVSEFYIRADKFAIGSPGEAKPTNITAYVPFYVRTTDQLINGKWFYKGVYMKSAVIGEASIESAHIKDVIQSSNYFPGSSGWMINMSGNAEFNGNVVVNGTLHANKIVSGSLSTDYQYELLGDYEKINGVDTLLIDLPINSYYTAGTAIQVVVNFSFGCPLKLTRVLVRVLDTITSAVLVSRYIYNRDGQPYEARSFSATRSFNINVPAWGYYTVEIFVRHATGGPANFNDPYIEVTEAYR